MKSSSKCFFFESPYQPISDQRYDIYKDSETISCTVRRAMVLFTLPIDIQSFSEIRTGGYAYGYNPI